MSKSKDSQDVLSDDPFDFSTLEGDIANSIEKLKTDLSKLRAGGRFNPEAVESLRVQPDKNNKQTIKLSDLAQVIPKGRTVQVLVGEQDVCYGCSMALRGSANLRFAACQTSLFSNSVIISLPDTATRSYWRQSTHAGNQHSTTNR